MSFNLQKNDFKLVDKHKNSGIKFLSATKVNKNIKFTKENVSLTDFKQGDIGNCGLMSALAAISSRPEFLSEIAPKVEHTSDGIRLHFNMFYKGNPVIVTVDDKLPFFKRSSDKELSLVNATSKNDDNFYLASFFEKAVIKQACFKSYDFCDAIHAEFVFSLISDCMTNCCVWSAEESKQFVSDCLNFEVDNKSSTVLTVVPHFYLQTRRN